MNDQSDPTPAIESVLSPGWGIPLWAAILCLIAAFVFSMWVYTSERGSASRGMRLLLAALRFGLLASVLWMLVGWKLRQYKIEQPELAIVVDTSTSMSTQDMSRSDSSALQSRLDAARELFVNLRPSVRRSLEQRYRWRWFSVAESLAGVSDQFSDWTLEPRGTQSRLGDNLTRVLERQAGRGTSAIIFISDGVNTAGTSLSDVEQLARTAAIPIHAVLVGKQSALPDARLSDLLISPEVYLGDQITAEITVIANDVSDARVRVMLSDASTGRALDETQVSLTSDITQRTAQLRFAPQQPGELKLRLSVSPLENETELSNNTLDTVVRVQDKTIQVLLVQQKPSYEFRFLKSLLERSTEADSQPRASFELYSVLQESDPEYVDQDASAIRLVPSNVQQLEDFDVFIFGSLDPSLISQRSQQAIFDAVTEAGAGCIFVYGSGSPMTELQGWPLGELLPVQELSTGPIVGGMASQMWRWDPTPLGRAALPMQLTDSSQESLGVWKRLPGFRALGVVGQPKPGAQTLAVAVGDQLQWPLLVTQYAGAGRVALQASDETYRWTSFEGDDLYYQRYWGQMLRWLSRGKLAQNVEVSTLSVEPRLSKLGQPLRFEVRLGKELMEAELPKQVEVVVDGEGVQRQVVSLSQQPQVSRLYQSTVNSFPPGTHRALLVRPATAEPPSQDFIVSTPPGEQANLRANEAGMRALALQSRGKFYDVSDAQRVFDELPNGQPTRLGSLPPVPFWNSSWVALWFVVLITTEWLLRRWVRML